MTVRELIEILQDIPEEWKNDQVTCFKDVYYEDEEDFDESVNEQSENSDDMSLPLSMPMLSPIENVSRISLARSNKDRTLFKMPIDAIVLE